MSYGKIVTKKIILKITTLCFKSFIKAISSEEIFTLIHNIFGIVLTLRFFYKSSLLPFLKKQFHILSLLKLQKLQNSLTLFWNHKTIYFTPVVFSWLIYWRDLRDHVKKHLFNKMVGGAGGTLFIYNCAYNSKNSETKRIQTDILRTRKFVCLLPTIKSMWGGGTQTRVVRLLKKTFFLLASYMQLIWQ